MDLWAFPPQARKRSDSLVAGAAEGRPAGLPADPLGPLAPQNGPHLETGSLWMWQEQVTLDGVGPRPLALSLQGEGG